ncbi:MAG: DNA-directed RNA polymerase subunit omega [Bdellovibrionales bacterium]|nr:DNA-directed RNA polymerase subunit omega [Bdellovibrionales bacterium]
MARVTVEDCLEKLNNRFALVILVSKRAKQLLKGVTPTLHVKNNKYVVTALREVAIGNIVLDTDLSSGSPEKQVEADLNR